MSDSTWPTSTPSAARRTGLVASAALPARSVATARSTSWSPGRASSGITIAAWNGGCVKLASGAPSTVRTTDANSRLSAAVTTAVPVSRRVMRSGAASSTLGASESRVTCASACPVRLPLTTTPSAVRSVTTPVTATDSSAVSAPGAGAAIVTTGAAVSSTKLRVLVVWLPAATPPVRRRARRP
jgi:hypothetical protein